MKIRIIGLLIFLVAVVGAISCGWYDMFLNIPSVAYVVLVAGGLGLVNIHQLKLVALPGSGFARPTSSDNFIYGLSPVVLRRKNKAVRLVCSPKTVPF